MLLDLLKNIMRGGRADEPASAADQGNLRHQQKPDSPEAHVMTGYMNEQLVARNMQIIFASSMFGDKSFLELYNDAIRRTRTGIAPHKWYRRAQRALHLSHYYTYSLSLPGAAAECGVALGLSSLLLNTVADLYPEQEKKDFYMIDSFEGLSEITEHDLVVTEDNKEGVSLYKQGDMSCPFDWVKSVFDGYPHVKMIKGWIPEAFDQLPEQQWSFVHIDVDLYEPTLGCLEYFYKRVVPGGVIINDDYGSPDFPGCGKAWRDFCIANSIPFVKFDTGQAVIIKQ
jgi:hypothetical protein